MANRVEPRTLTIPAHVDQTASALCQTLSCMMELWVFDGDWKSRGFFGLSDGTLRDSGRLRQIATRSDLSTPTADGPSLIAQIRETDKAGREPEGLAVSSEKPLELQFSDQSQCQAWCISSSWPQWWATRPFWPSSIPTDSAESNLSQAERLLDLDQSLDAQSRRIEDLEHENSALIQQLSSDFDEISLLRALSEHLDVSDLIHDFVSLAEKVFPDVRRAVRSEVIALIPVQQYQSSLAADEAAVWIGPKLLSGPECSELIEGHLTELQQLGQQDLRSYLCRDAQKWPRVKSFIIAPLYRSSQFFGVILALNQDESARSRIRFDGELEDGPGFGKQECTLLSTIASIMSVHASNVSLFQEKEQLTTDMIRALVTAIDAKDEYTRGHSERVALYGQRLGQEAGMSLQDCERLYLTGLLHDIGKIGISDAVLKKPSCLTDEEFAEIMRHPDEGWAILCDLEHLEYTLPGVLHHHERWDGCGYPDGLKGEAIPLHGRILAIVDGFDAMTSDRPYRKGMPTEKAAQILRNGAGTQWDPMLVDLFLRILPEIELIRSFYKSPVKRVRQRDEKTRDRSA